MKTEIPSRPNSPRTAPPTRGNAPARRARPWRVLSWALPLACWLVQGSAAWALCADATGDGWIRATDALLALRAAVANAYDPRLDVYPTESGDGSVTAADAAAILHAAAGGTIPACAASQAERLVALTTASCDFVTGGVALLDARAHRIVSERPGVTKADAVIRNQAGRVFALNRFGGNTVTELDPADGLAPLWSCGVGTGSNPHDIVVAAPDKGYVTRYDSTKLAIIDPSAGPNECAGFLRGTIDLGPWADADGFPEMDQMALVGHTLFVVLQRLDRDSFFRPREQGALVAIDTDTDTVIDVTELSIQNPFEETKGLYRDPHTGLLWVAGPGRLFTDLTDGGIERIDPSTHASLGVLATGAELGGDLTDLAVVGTSRAYALVAGANFRVSLVEVDLEKGTPVAVLATSDELFSDIELTESGELWLADRNCFNPGVRVFSIADNRELTPDPIATQLAPFTLVFAE